MAFVAGLLIGLVIGLVVGFALGVWDEQAVDRMAHGKGHVK